MEYGIKITGVGVATLLLSGCGAMFVCPDDGEVRLLRTPTEHMINNGIKNYEDGNYAVSVATLQTLVESKDATQKEKILAYKYLAFNRCVSPKDEKKLCRESFKKALELDPNFELSPAEADHPMWGPEFKAVKKPAAK